MNTSLLFLGTGTSSGVPMIGCNCEVCHSKNLKDKRLRSSVLLRVNSKAFLIDIGPDFRHQFLISKLNKIDAILLTHEHRDHTAGLDDLRPIYYKHRIPINIYLEERVKKSIQSNFSYLFSDISYPGMPKIYLNTISEASFVINGVQVIPIRVMHKTLPILGYRIGNVCYITDANFIDEQEIKKMQNLEVLVINALQQSPHISHFHLEQTLYFIDKIKPKKAYLTHIGHAMGLHDKVNPLLPENVYLAYDNLEINIKI